MRGHKTRAEFRANFFGRRPSYCASVIIPINDDSVIDAGHYMGAVEIVEHGFQLNRITIMKFSIARSLLSSVSKFFPQ
jgi:hypothetical protein